MRITNSMQVNNTLLNINKNRWKMNLLETQYMTTKKIQYASEDPIIAARALRFRTSVSQIEQYKRNAAQGEAWQNTTESAFQTFNKMLYRLEELLVQASSESLGIDDRNDIIAEIQEIRAELATTLNASYLGRYVFSGLRTDNATTFMYDDPSAHFEITEHLNPSMFEKITLFDKGNGQTRSTHTGAPESYEATVIKLAYMGIDSGITSVPDSTTIQIVHTDNSPIPVVTNYPITVNQVMNSTDVNAYNPPANQVYYLEDTGELVFGDSAKDYVESVFATPVPGTITWDVTYEKTGFAAGDPNPVVYFDCQDMLTGDNYIMDNQDFIMEFGTGNRFAINILGKDAITSTFLSDLDILIHTVVNLNISTVEELRALGNSVPPVAPFDAMTDEELEDWISDERSAAQTVITDRFTKMLTKLDIHTSAITQQQTSLATKMNRIEMVKERLADEEVNYTGLLSDNEDAEMQEVLVKLNALYMIYSSSLQVAANILQMSIISYI